MLSALKSKLSKFNKTDDSIVKKLNIIKDSEQYPTSPVYSPDGEPISFDSGAAAAQMSQMQEETINKMEEMMNAKLEAVNTNTESIGEMGTKLGKMDIAVSGTKRGMEEYDERFNKMEETILELLSLYEIVSNSINPFVGDSDNNNPVDNEKLQTIDKRLSDLYSNFEQLSNNISSIDTSLTDKALQQVRIEFDKKINELNNKLEEFDSNIEINKKSDIEPLPEIPDVQKSNMPQVQQVQQASQDQHISNEYQVPQEASNTPDSNQFAQLVDIKNDPESSIVLLNWVEFLMEKVGKNNLMDVLDYYIDTEWISEKVSNKILVYANGIDYYDEKPTWKLMPEDHTKSLMFIERLRGRKIDLSALHKIERDVDKVKHHSETFFDI